MTTKIMITLVITALLTIPALTNAGGSEHMRGGPAVGGGWGEFERSDTIGRRGWGDDMSFTTQHRTYTRKAANYERSTFHSGYWSYGPQFQLPMSLTSTLTHYNWGRTYASHNVRVKSTGAYQLDFRVSTVDPELRWARPVSRTYNTKANGHQLHTRGAVDVRIGGYGSNHYVYVRHWENLSGTGAGALLWTSIDQGRRRLISNYNTFYKRKNGSGNTRGNFYSTSARADRGWWLILPFPIKIRDGHLVNDASGSGYKYVTLKSNGTMR